MTGTAVATRENFAIANQEAAEAFAAALEGAGPEDLDLPRIKVPGSGGTIWEVPSGDPDNPNHEKAIVGVIVDHYAVDVLYVDKFEGGNEPPDALWIGGEFQYANERAIEAGVIEGEHRDKQPLNEYETALYGAPGGKAISNKWRVFIVQGGDLLPSIIDIPTMSRKAWINFNAMRIAGRGHKTTDVVVSLGLTKKTNKGGIDYAEIVPTLAFVLDDEDKAHFAAQAASLRPLTRRVAIEAPATSGSTIEAGEGEEEV